MTSRYAAVHASPKGPGDARPTALDIVKDEGLEGKLTDKTVVITGCSSGIGVETARAMAATGAKIFAGVRDTAKGEKALSDILKPGHVELLRMDLNSLDSIRAAAEEFKSRSKGLNILINNAGVMATPEGKTADGFETQFGTNHLAHFLLFQLLRPLLLSSASVSFPSRVINVSSSGHRTSPPLYTDYNFAKTPYNKWLAYGQSKTANIHMANHIDRLYGAQNLHAYSLMPGGIETGLQVHNLDMMKAYSGNQEVMNYMKSPAQGAATSVWAALAKEWASRGGVYLEDCQESWPVKEGGGPTATGYATWAFDEEGEERLWRDSLGMVGLKEE